MYLTGKDIIELLRKHSDLGHDKQNKAFIRQVSFACASPGTSVPRAAGKAAGKIPLADAAAMYRFAGNDKIPISELRAVRAKTVLEQSPEGSDILIVHDMSLLDYSRHHSKQDRRPIGDYNGMGYEYVPCIAVDPATATTLGVIHDTLINEDGPDDRDVMDYDYEPLFAHFSKKEKQRLRENHRHQMAVHINGTASLLAGRHVIDVADREFDDIFILDCCRQNKRDFVIRSLANRNVQAPAYEWLPQSAATEKQSGHALEPGHICVNMEQLIAHAPMQPYKSLPLDAKNRVAEKSNAKRHADLSIGSFRAILYRDAKRNGQNVRPPRPVGVNIVVIRETNPPHDCKPLFWVLFTSLPADSLEQLAYVGRIYELRWKIEDYFRLLKSGYRILDSRLDNAAKIARLLVVLAIAAMALLSLKQMVGLAPKGTMCKDDYQRVKTAMLEPDNPAIDLNLRLFAFIAKSGGWLGRRADPIGPTILMRGLLYYLDVIDSFSQARSLIEESLQKRNVFSGRICV